jgi:transcriptional regulator with XRE-family HTH domain
MHALRTHQVHLAGECSTLAPGDATGDEPYAVTGGYDAASDGLAFGPLLLKHRLHAGLSQEELAERAGLSRRGISDLERGQRRAPYLATVRRLADALGLDEPGRSGLLAAARPPRTLTDNRTRWTLQVREPSSEERTIPLGPESVTVGRDLACTVVVNSPFVSRQHARIEPGVEYPTVSDLGSRNGTSINGVRLDGSRELRPGDVVTLGDVDIVCLAGPDAAPATGRLPGARTHGETREAGADRLRVDAQLYQVWIGRRCLERRLSAQEFELLRYLYEHDERVCTRRELGDSIWGEDNWEPNMLHRLMHRLKEKLEPRPDAPRYVQTVPQVGYRLTT